VAIDQSNNGIIMTYYACGHKANYFHRGDSISSDPGFETASYFLISDFNINISSQMIYHDQV
jgi:hypothetical protein